MEKLNLKFGAGAFIDSMQESKDKKELAELRAEKLASHQFTRGFACAIVVLLKYEGQDTAICCEMFGSGIGSIKQAIAAGVDEYDLEELKKYFK